MEGVVLPGDEVAMVAAVLIVEATEGVMIPPGVVTVVATGDGQGAMRHTDMLATTPLQFAHKSATHGKAVMTVCMDMKLHKRYEKKKNFKCALRIRVVEKIE